jgi:S1-C subfamily serine protease
MAGVAINRITLEEGNVKKYDLYQTGTGFIVVLMLVLAATAGPSLGLFQAKDVVASSAVTQATALPFRDAIYDVATKVKPAIVQVTNEQVVMGSLNQAGAIPVGVGSGVIYDDQGHILTNDHVVEGASSLIVLLPDGRTFQATLIGTDPQTDLAVVQISGSNLPVAELGDSTQMRVGDWVVAIGNALALSGGPTVTAGLVSAMGRTIEEPPPSSGALSQIAGSGPYLFNLIQTSAAINPGNSGGALVNLDGQVIGINTLGGGSTGQGTQTEGIGFAIAMETAKPIADELVATGTVSHPYLGADYVALSPALSAQYGIPTPYGDYVTYVAPGSPAAQAGLQTDDVITEAEGTALTDDSALALIVHAHKPGDTLTLTVLRGRQTLTVKVTLGSTN